MSHLSPEQWDAVEADYISGRWSVAGLARRYRVSASSIYRHARQGDWRARRFVKMENPAGGAKQYRETVAISSSTDASAKEVLLDRLLRMASVTLDEIDSAYAAAGARTAIERERDTRTLGAIMRILEKLNDQKVALKGERRPSWMSRDDEEICRDLSREIDRFQRARKKGAIGVSKS